MLGSRLAIFVVFCCACGARPLPELLPEPAPTEAGTGLVWIADAEGRHQTLWVSLEDGRPLASQPIEGPVWAAGAQLWQWIDEPVRVPLDACGGAAEADSATLQRVTLNELTESLTVELRPLPSIEASREAAHAIVPVASVGPYLFVVEELRVAACGEENSSEATEIIWDLRAAQPARVLTPRERWSISSAEARLARERLTAELDRGPPTEELVSAEPANVELAALWPRWDPSAGLAVEYVFVMEACDACGDGEWGAYTRATRVPALSLPQRLSRHARVPHWARAALERRAEGATLLGFSEVLHPAPARVLEALRR
jgi:hypothetical protein